MLNLVGNAIKFTDDGSITITVQWLKSKPFSDECFQPEPFDDMNEGVFEKEENISTVGLDEGDIRQGQNRYFLLSRGKTQIHLSDVQSLNQHVEGILKIVVKDTGCGMTQAALGQLFKKFSQVSTDARKKQIGTGLGLFIAKEICQKMGGDVRAYSKPTLGTAFIVCIPTATVVNTSQVLPDMTASSMIEELSSTPTKAIVADDSIFNVNMISRFLSKIAVQVVKKAGNGYDAYNSYKESLEAGIAVDIVTLDIDMPKMDGKVACQKIREYEKHNNIKPAIIILISGNYEEQQLSNHFENNAESRANCFLKKPVSFEDFISTIYQQRLLR